MEVIGLINFIEWIILVIVVFLVANVVLRQVKKRITN